MKKFNVVLLFALLIFAFPAFAQEDVPDFYKDVFSADLLAAISAVIAITKLARNAFGDIKGMPALIITFVVAIAYGFFQYGINDQPWWYGVLSGVLAALSFYLTKNIGKLVFQNPLAQGVFGKLQYFAVRKENQRLS